jgi:hypothetical protein
MLRLVLAVLLATAPALARAEPLRFGDDAFYSGGSVTVDAADTDDVFAAAERIEVTVPVGGSAHLGARRIAVDAAVGEDLYAAAADLTVASPVGGDAVLAGYDVDVNDAVGHDLRAFGRTVRVSGPVTGSALIAGASVALDASIGGDAAISADSIQFGPDAKVGGLLTLSGSDAETLVVPESVAPPERIERHHEPVPPPLEGPGRSWFAVAMAFAIGVVILAALATLVAALAPHHLERLRDLTAERPFRTFWIGFLTLAVLIGGAVLAVLTVVGVIVAPAILLAAAVFGLLGYLVAVYLVGRAVWDWTGQLPPDSVPERGMAALLGAAAVSLVAVVPLFGWLFLLLLTVVGLGALCVGVLRPEFRS